MNEKLAEMGPVRRTGPNLGTGPDFGTTGQVRTVCNLWFVCFAKQEPGRASQKFLATT